MEPLAAFFDEEWDCFCRMFAIAEHDCSPQFLGQSSLLLGEDDGVNIGIQSVFCFASEYGGSESMFYALDAHNSNLQHISVETSDNSNCSGHTLFVDNPDHTNCYFSYPDNVLANTSVDFCMMDEKNPGSVVQCLTDILVGETVSLNEDGRSDSLENFDHSKLEPIVFLPSQLENKRMLVVPEPEGPVQDKLNSSENQRKKPRVSKDVQRCMNNARSNVKFGRNGNEAEETNAGSDGQSSSSYSSEDDNAYRENDGGAFSASESQVALNLKGKRRAGRGSATDPQSLYARKRRGRINERLRILQNLVPNGTKVDTSTMLEEAIHHVKFLQLQIKLLSSDDLWMFAPIAYNGLDIGLNICRKISRQFST